MHTKYRLSSNRVSLNEIIEMKKIHLIIFLVLEFSFWLSLIQERRNYKCFATSRSHILGCGLVMATVYFDVYCYLAT